MNLTHRRAGASNTPAQHLPSGGGGNMSLRNVFASRGREASLRLEDIAGSSAGGGGGGGSSGSLKKPGGGGGDKDAAGLAAAMSIARLFLPAERVRGVADGNRSLSYFREKERPEGRVDEEDDDAIVINLSKPKKRLNGSGGGSARTEEDEDEDEDERRIRRVLDKVNAMRSEHEAELLRAKVRISDLERENAEMKLRWKKSLTDVDDRHTMAEYAKLIMEQMPHGSVSDSTYVLKLQSQLCRALHKMGILTEQIELLENQENEKVKDLQSQIVEQGNESFRAEVEHMNDLLEMEREMEGMREEHESESSVQQGQLAKMEVELDFERSIRCDAMSYAKLAKKDLVARGEARDTAPVGQEEEWKVGGGGQGGRATAGGRMRRRGSRGVAAAARGVASNRRASDRSDATAKASNTSDGQLECELPVDVGDNDGVDRRNDNGREGDGEEEEQYSLEEAVEFVMPVGGEVEDFLVDDIRRGAEDNEGPEKMKDTEDAKDGNDDMDCLRLELRDSHRIIDELRATIAEQRMTIRRLALDHGEMKKGILK